MIISCSCGCDYFKKIKIIDSFTDKEFEAYQCIRCNKYYLEPINYHNYTKDYEQLNNYLIKLNNEE